MERTTSFLGCPDRYGYPLRCFVPKKHRPLTYRKVKATEHEPDRLRREADAIYKQFMSSRDPTLYIEYCVKMSLHYKAEAEFREERGLDSEAARGREKEWRDIAYRKMLSLTQI